MTKDEALKLALEALELHLTHHEHGCVYLDPAVTAIKEALAQPEQEHAKQMAKLGWQYFECPACGSEGARAFPKPDQEPTEYVQKVIDALYENSDPVSVEAAELLERMAQRIPQSIPQIPQKHSSNAPHRKPLTDKDIDDIVKNYALSNPTTPLHFARAVEAAHGIKGEA